MLFIVKVKQHNYRRKMKEQDTIVLFTEKRDRAIKARSIYNGKDTRDKISREDSAS